MNNDEFEARIGFHHDQMHQAFLRDDGSIERLEDNVRVVAAALDFIAQVATIVEEQADADLYEQCEAMGMNIGGLLVSNTTRLIHARQAEAELEMLNTTMVTIH